MCHDSILISDKLLAIATGAYEPPMMARFECWCYLPVYTIGMADTDDIVLDIESMHGDTNRSQG